MHILTKVAPGWPKPPPSLAAVIAHGEYETWPRGRIIYEQPPDRVCHLRRSATAGCPASPPDQDPLPLAASVNDRARRPALPQHTLYRPPVAPTYHQRRTVRRQAKQPNRQTPPSCRQQLLEKRPRRTARSTWMAVSAPSARSSWHSLTLPGRDANHDLGLRGCRSTTHPFPTRKPSIGSQIFAPMCLAEYPRDRQPALRHDDDTTNLARICG
jgi:hypothetical protein